MSSFIYIFLEVGKNISRSTTGQFNPAGQFECFYMMR